VSGRLRATLAVLTLAAAGCGNTPPAAQPPPEPPVDPQRLEALRAAFRAQARAMQDVALILGRVQDRASMPVALDRLAVKYEEVERANAALRSFADLPAPVLERTAGEFAGELTAATESMRRESARILDEVPGGKEFLDAAAKTGKGAAP
jgi:hypothetical protein